MKNQPFYLIAIFLLSLSIHAQKDTLRLKSKDRPQVYNYNNKLDIPLTAGATLITLYNFSQIYDKGPSSEETILALNKNDINGFDKRAAGNYNESAKRASDFFFNTAIPLPLIFFAFDKKMKKDYLRLTLLYVESMSFTGLTYSTSQQLNDRLRPFTYNQDLDLNFRTGSGAKNSFYSGHTSLVATSTFFLAKVYSDYHPNSKYKWVLFTTAGIATILTGHLRVRAGQHFPTDVLVGGIMGTAAGILTPHFHKNKLFKNENLSLLPITGEYHGLQLSLKF